MKQITDWLIFAPLFVLTFLYPYAFSWAYGRNARKKYIIVNNEFLRKLLINSHERHESKYVKVEDRKKLTVYSLVLYIILAVVLVMALVMMFIPEMPCEPFDLPVGRRGGSITIDSWNDKLPMLNICLILSTVALSLFIELSYKAIVRRKTVKMKRVEIIEMILISAVTLLFLFCVGWILFRMFLF